MILAFMLIKFSLGQSSFYTSSISNDDVIDSVTCPYVGAPLSLCTYNTTSDGVCNNSYSDIYAQCSRSKLSIILLFTHY